MISRISPVSFKSIVLNVKENADSPVENIKIPDNTDLTITQDENKRYRLFSKNDPLADVFYASRTFSRIDEIFKVDGKSHLILDHVKGLPDQDNRIKIDEVNSTGIVDVINDSYVHINSIKSGIVRVGNEIDEDEPSDKLDKSDVKIGKMQTADGQLGILHINGKSAVNADEVGVSCEIHQNDNSSLTVKDLYGLLHIYNSVKTHIENMYSNIDKDEDFNGELTIKKENVLPID